MTTLQKVMRSRRVKYFSQLTPNQKDKASNIFLKAYKNVLDVPIGLAMAIIMQTTSLEQILTIEAKLLGQKMFYYEPLKVYILLKIKELLND